VAASAAAIIARRKTGWRGISSMRRRKQQWQRNEKQDGASLKVALMKIGAAACAARIKPKKRQRIENKHQCGSKQ
jgi:hypothetical protein